MSDGGALFVVSAPSGAGKSTLIGRLMAAVTGVEFSVSWTTRPARPGERDGVDYHFTDEATFRARIAAGEFLEWAEVHGRLYGTARAEALAALAAGKDLVLDIDVQGAAQVRRSGNAAEFIFVMPPSFETLAARLRGRGTEPPDALERRLSEAAREIQRYREFDHIVINDDLETAAADLIAIVRAARTRRGRLEARARAIADGFPGGRSG